MSRNTWVIASCLLGIILSLLLVGIISATLLRHVVQVIPAAVALVAVARRALWGPHAALPLFIFWLLIMLAIWLWLLGIARIVTGRFTPAEIVLTVVIGTCCAGGIVASLRTPTTTSRTWRLLMFAMFVAFQIGAMWLSLRQPFSHD